MGAPEAGPYPKRGRRSLTSRLRGFCADIGSGQHLPQRRWLVHMVYGMLSSRSVMLSEVARSLSERDRHHRPRRLIHTEKRLSRNLNSDRLDDAAVTVAFFNRARQLTTRDDGRGVVVAVDYTDLAKPYARPGRPRGMELACRCRDGSTNTVGTGYPVVQIEASTPDGNRVPLVYRPFSFDAVGFRSQNLEFLSAVSEASAHVGPKAIWVMDRGFDGRAFFKGMDSAGVRWACRLKTGARNERSVVYSDAGTERTEKTSQAAMAVVDRWTYDMPRGRGRRRRTFKITFGSRRVRIKPGQSRGDTPGPERTLVVAWGISKAPLVILASEYRKGRAFALEVFLAYIRRWRCEEATRSMKDSRGWGIRVEDVRVLKFRGICRIMMLAAAVYLFLAELRDAGGTVLTRAIGAIQAFGDTPPDGTYRLLRGISSVLASLPNGLIRGWARRPRTKTDRSGGFTC